MYAPHAIDSQTGTAAASVAPLQYELLTAHVDDPQQMSYTTYGICVRDENGTIVFNHADISTSKEYVQGFIDMVSERDVSSVHIKDILEDYLD